MNYYNYIPVIIQSIQFFLIGIYLKKICVIFLYLKKEKEKEKPKSITTEQPPAPPKCHKASFFDYFKENHQFHYNLDFYNEEIKKRGCERRQERMKCSRENNINNNDPSSSSSSSTVNDVDRNSKKRKANNINDDDDDKQSLLTPSSSSSSTTISNVDRRSKKLKRK